jgi:parallel beta-helix repeat protein
MPKKTVYTAVFTILLLVGALTLKIQTANAVTTVYIKPDGSIYPPSAPILTTDNVTYTLNASANIAITIQRSNITFDGKGYTINGTGSETGFTLADNVVNVTIKNVKIQNFYYGVLISNSSNYNTLTRNTITTCYYGIYINTSSNCAIVENTIGNNKYGVYLQLSQNGNLTSNTISTNTYHGLIVNSSSDNTISKDTITSNNHGIEFINSQNNNVSVNTITSNYGTGILVTRSSFTAITANTIKQNSHGIELTHSLNNSITQNTITTNSEAGIFLTNSTYNTINKNNLTSNNHGIYLYYTSDYNTITESNITSNKYYGMIVDSSSSNTIANNTIMANNGGIKLTSSSNNNLQNNTIFYNAYNFEVWGLTPTHYVHNIDTSNKVDEKSIYYLVNRQDEEIPSDAGYVALVNCTKITIRNLNLTKNGQGIMLAYTTDTTIKENIIMNNYYGIRMRDSSNNQVYHNAFINNTVQVGIYNSINFWDNSYLSGGNYWSDYSEADIFRGVYQNETNSDGIGDKPYVIDANNKDNYPLMKIYGGPNDIGIKNLAKTETIVANGYTLNINITIINYSVETKTFNLTAYANTSIINSLLNITLESRNSITVTLAWNTSSFIKGNYTISAVASPVQDETDIKDNTFVNGNVFVLSPEHDVAVTEISFISAIGQGYVLPIKVNAMNVGNYTETFNISVFANSTFIESQNINLESGKFDTLYFMWNTSTFTKGNYIISVYAEAVLNETDLSDNERVRQLLIARVGDFGGPVDNVPTFFACDDKIDGYDLALFIYCYKGLAQPEFINLIDLGSGPPPTFFACDGKVDGYDLALFIQCYKGRGP